MAVVVKSGSPPISPDLKLKPLVVCTRNPAANIDARLIAAVTGANITRVDYFVG